MQTIVMYLLVTIPIWTNGKYQQLEVKDILSFMIRIYRIIQFSSFNKFYFHPADWLYR